MQLDIGEVTFGWDHHRPGWELHESDPFGPELKLNQGSIRGEKHPIENTEANWFGWVRT